MNKKLLDILVCPECKGSVTLDKKQVVICSRCHLVYPIKNDIAVMVRSKAYDLEKNND